MYARICCSKSRNKNAIIINFDFNREHLIFMYFVLIFFKEKKRIIEKIFNYRVMHVVVFLKWCIFRFLSDKM
jgi:hypothetical protein